MESDRKQKIRYSSLGAFNNFSLEILMVKYVAITFTPFKAYFFHS